jgi:hypothetical protein
MPHDDPVRALFEEALRRPPEVTIPAGFTRRVLERAEPVPPPRSVLPYAVAASAVVALALIAAAPPVLRETVAWVLAAMGEPRRLLTLPAAEGILCLLWLWREARA